MARLTPEQRLQIVQLYYANNSSVRATFRALRPFYGPHNRPTELQIRRTVDRFCSTFTVCDNVHPERRRSVRTQEAIENVRQSVENDASVSVRRRAQQLNLCPSTMWNILRQDIGSHANKIEIQPTSIMSEKRKNMTHVASRSKKRRNVIDMHMKMKIIKEHDDGKKVHAIAKSFGMAHSTISTIIKDKEKIKETVKSSIGYDATITRQRKGLVHEMEKLLALWIDDQIQKRMPVSLLLIQTKARSIFKTLKSREGEESVETFTASHGWFQRFQLRFRLHNRSVVGEAASADAEAAEKFIKELDKIVEEGGYLPEQIFNVDETALFWKKMPERSYIHTEAKCMPGFKAYKDHLTLLLGGNVAGFKLKPLVIYRPANPRAFEQVDKHTLPVHYLANNMAWMTQALFEDWLINCFIPAAKQYCIENKIPFKILLLLDNAPGHSPHLDGLHANVKVVYLPKNTTSILQPMDQGAISVFKKNYLYITFSKALAATEDNKMTLREFWRDFNILQCIKNIEVAWQEVTEICMKGMWKKCLKRFVDNFEEFENDEFAKVIHKKIVDLAKVLDLECDEKEVQELVDYQEGELSTEDLIELEQQQRLEEKEIHGVNSTGVIEDMTEGADCAEAVPQSGNVLCESEFIAQQNKIRKTNSSVRIATEAVQVNEDLEWDFDTFARNVATRLKELPLVRAVVLQRKIENMIAQEFQKTLVDKDQVPAKHRLPNGCKQSASPSTSRHSVESETTCASKLEIHGVNSTGVIEDMTEGADCAEAVPQSGNVLRESEFIAQQNKIRKTDSSVRIATEAVQVNEDLEWDFDTFARNVATRLKELPLVRAVVLQRKIENMIAQEFQKTLVDKDQVPAKHRLPNGCKQSASPSTSRHSVESETTCASKLLKRKESAPAPLNVKGSLINRDHYEKCFYARNQSASGEEGLSRHEGACKNFSRISESGALSEHEGACKNRDRQNSRISESGALRDFSMVYIDVANDDIGEDYGIPEDAACVGCEEEKLVKTEICDEEFIKTEDWDPQELERVQQDLHAFKNLYKIEGTPDIEVKQEPEDKNMIT